jgi:hypothetical protein
MVLVAAAVAVTMGHHSIGATVVGLPLLQSFTELLN